MRTRIFFIHPKNKLENLVMIHNLHLLKLQMLDKMCIYIFLNRVVRLKSLLAFVGFEGIWCTVGPNRNALFQTHLIFMTTYIWSFVWNFNIRWCWSIWKSAFTLLHLVVCPSRVVGLEFPMSRTANQKFREMLKGSWLEFQFQFAEFHKDLVWKYI